MQHSPWCASSASQVLKRGAYSVVQAVRTIPECSSFPYALAAALTDRVATWFLPMYGCRTEADELSNLSEDELQGGYHRTTVPPWCEAGWLAGRPVG